jgi:hypothetical protein
MPSLRTAPRAPLAVAGILAMPLFFVGLMAMSLAVEKPSVEHAVKRGKAVTLLGDPTGTTEAKIWLLAVVPPLALVLFGVATMLLRRTGVVVTSLGAIALSVALLVPLGGWANGHAGRFPVGVDLIPPNAQASQDIYLRGEWEANAKRTAEQLGIATMSIAGAAIAVVLLLEFRRRRGLVRPTPPPPPVITMGGVPPVSE